MTKRITVTLSDEAHEALRLRAKAERRSMDAQAGLILDRALLPPEPQEPVIVPGRHVVTAWELVAQRERAEDRVRALHYGYKIGQDGSDACNECSKDWPCPTLVALAPPDAADQSADHR